jgi:hypothetical protein
MYFLFGFGEQLSKLCADPAVLTDAISRVETRLSEPSVGLR